MILELAASALTANGSDAPLLLDARCDPVEYAGAARHELGAGVTLHARYDAHFLALCFTLPEGSFGSFDLYVRAADGRLHNLHVSAQVGERVRAAGGWPDWRFGNQQGWYGPPVAFRGMATDATGQRRIDFAPAAGRELQISRARFGADPWRVRFEIRALGAAQNGVLVFPAGSTDSDPAGWARLDFRR
jgi:hypothetical protein